MAFFNCLEFFLQFDSTQQKILFYKTSLKFKKSTKSGRQFVLFFKQKDWINENLLTKFR